MLVLPRGLRYMVRVYKAAMRFIKEDEDEEQKVSKKRIQQKAVSINKLVTTLEKCAVFFDGCRLCRWESLCTTMFDKVC
jgi:hypothetical protein